MNPYVRWMAILVSVIMFVPTSQAFGSSDATLEIVEPAPMQTLNTSNVQITVRFNFNMQAEQKPFRAWLNGKPVGSLFSFTESLDATALLSAADGMKASVKGPRMNVFRAEVRGPDGEKHTQTLWFLVNCSANRAPVADAGQYERVFVNEIVVLDGSGSADGDGDPMTYRWSFVSVPKKSKAKLSDPSSVTPSFVPDMPGAYVARLIADDYKAKSEPKFVEVKVDQLKILIDRPVLNSAIFEKVSHHGTVAQFDGSRLPAGYHLAVLDGAASTPEELRKNLLVREALAEGLRVLVLNVTDDDKTQGLASHLGIVSKGKSSAYLFRRFLDGNTPVFRIFDLPVPDIAETEIDPEIFLRYASLLLKELRQSREGSLRSLQAPAPDNPIPDGLINCRWDYAYTLPWTLNYSGRQPVDHNRIQNGSYIVNYTFTLFLDNGNNPTGNKQFLLLQIDGEGNPNNYGSTFLATSSDMDKHNEYAWFQDKFTVDINPGPLGSPHVWRWVNNDPTSPNHTTTYTSNASFMMGFNQAQGGLGSFTYSCGKSYTLSDWGISCNSSGNYMYWESLSTNPPEHDGGYDSYDDMYDWFYGMGKPMRPNTMSMNQTQYHASVVWASDAVVNQTATFNSHIRAHVADNWCSKDLGTTCCSSWNTHSSVKDFTKDLTWSLDLGAVIPIDIAAITFSPDPVLVGPLGGTIRGNVVLATPAKVDTQIIGISSNDPHATPKTDRVVVPKGGTTASFDIFVNAQGVTPGQYFFATISAFYAKGYSQQLRMQAIN